MRGLFFMFITIVCSSLYSQESNNEKHSKITYSPQFEFAISTIPGKDSLISQFEHILNFHDSNSIICNEGDDLKKFMLDELFPSIYPKDQIEFHLLNISKLSQDLVKIRMINKIDFTNWGAEYNNYFYTNYIYDVYLKKADDDWKMDVSLQLENFEKIKTAFGFYLFDKTQVNKKLLQIKESKKYIKSTAKKFDLDFPENNLIYYVSDRNDAFKIFGFSYSISITGMYFKELNILINPDLNSLDKHEMTHYIFGKSAPGKFLSEGIAVYQGGSNGVEKSSFIQNTIQNDYKNLSEEDKVNWVNNFLQGRLEGGPYMKFYYACSGLLINQYLMQNESSKIKSVIETKSEINPEEFIKSYFIQKEETPFTYLTNLIENSWNEN